MLLALTCPAPNTAQPSPEGSRLARHQSFARLDRLQVLSRNFRSLAGINGLSKSVERVQMGMPHDGRGRHDRERFPVRLDPVQVKDDFLCARLDLAGQF